MKKIFVHYKDIIKIFVIMMLIEIITLFGITLFIIPGVIMIFNFSIVPYIYRENKHLDILSLLKLSCKIMSGNKMKLLLFEFSFILWFLLVVSTFGFAIIWVGPYSQVSYAIFYSQIKEEYYASNLI